jgi:predicted histone-like DNA-binding protein
VSGADIRAVLYGLVDVITDELSDGRIVRLGDLGSLRISISSEGKDTIAEVDSSSIRSAKYIFSPGSRLKMLLPNLKYKKA